MKKKLITIIFAIHSVISFAQWSIVPTIGIGAAMTDDSDIGTANIEIQYNISPLFSFGLLSEYHYEAMTITTEAKKYSNLVFEVKSDIASFFDWHYTSFFIDTGFGWGHHFTTAVTDHNYHTYRLGIDYRLYNEDRSVGGVFRIGTMFRTFSEHIGFNPDYGKIYINVGFVVSI